jgi:hypothetical protein
LSHLFTGVPLAFGVIHLELFERFASAGQSGDTRARRSHRAGGNGAERAQ